MPAPTTLAAMGAEVHRGSLEDPDSLRDGARQADGVIHTAFNHDFSRFAENCENDRRAIEAMGAALEGSDRPLLVTSGLALLAPGRLATEDDKAVARFPARLRDSGRGRRGARHARVGPCGCAPSTHGAGDHGFVPHLISLAREKGVSAYVGDGRNRWPACIVSMPPGSIGSRWNRASRSGPYHAVAEEGVPFKAIAEVIGRRLGVPVVSKTPEEAAEHFGWFARFAGMDIPSSSARTRSALGWKPEQPGLIADLDQPHYFGG